MRPAERARQADEQAALQRRQAAPKKRRLALMHPANFAGRVHHARVTITANYPPDRPTFVDILNHYDGDEVVGMLILRVKNRRRRKVEDRTLELRMLDYVPRARLLQLKEHFEGWTAAQITARADKRRDEHYAKPLARTAS